MTRAAVRARETALPALVVCEEFLEECEGLPREAARSALLTLRRLLREPIALDDTDRLHRVPSSVRAHRVTLDRRLIVDHSAEPPVVLALWRPQPTDDMTAFVRARRRAHRRFEIDLGRIEELLRSSRAQPAWHALRSLLHLTPEQARCVGRTVSGPLLLRGGPGSGKTTVGLRRALFLARQNLLERAPRVLFLASREDLIPVLERQLRAVADEVAPRITVSTVDRFLRRWCAAAPGRPMPLSTRRFRELVEHAAALAGEEGAHPLLCSTEYLAEEIASVLLDRSLREWETYRTTPRPGRGRPLDSARRRVVWQVFRHFLELSEPAAGSPHAALPGRIERALQREEEVPFDHVVVDDAHECSVGELRLCRALASDTLTLLASDTPPAGGDRYALAGLALAGRTARLPSPHRGHAPLQRFLCSLRATRKPTAKPRNHSALFATDDAAPPAALFPAGAHEARPKLWIAADWREEARWVVAIIQRRLEAGESPQSIAVLAARHTALDRVQQLLTDKSIPLWRLDEGPARDGASRQEGAAEREPRSGSAKDLTEFLGANAVKLLVPQDARGLEFPCVILAEVNAEVYPATPPARSMEARRARGELHLAASRAVHELVMTASRNRVSRLLDLDALDVMEVPCNT